MRTSKQKAAGATAPADKEKDKSEGEKPENDATKKPAEGAAAEPETPAEEEEDEAQKAALAAATEAGRAAGHAAGRAEALAEAQALAETCELAGQPAKQVAALLKAGKTGAAAREEILKARDAAIAGQDKITGQHDGGLSPAAGASPWAKVHATIGARYGVGKV